METGCRTRVFKSIFGVVVLALLTGIRKGGAAGIVPWKIITTSENENHKGI